VFRFRCTTRAFGRIAAIATIMALSLTSRVAHAGGMDLTLERLRRPAGEGGCPVSASNTPCADNEAFERLVSELAVTVSQPVSAGAATLGPAGFYLGVSSTVTPISASQFPWRNGTLGDGSSKRNTSPDGALMWNRFAVRKGLPFGFEIGTSAGQGVDSSMWVLSAELKWAILEGFHSGLGHFPDLAIHGVLSSVVGARALSMRTDSFDITLSKPFVVAEAYRVTPLLALQALFMTAKSGRVDLTPQTDAFAACAPTPGSVSSTVDPGTIVHCTKDGSDLANDVVFNTVTHTRVRLFAGVEVTHAPVSTSLSLGYDLAVPNLVAHTTGDGNEGGLAHLISFQLSLGLRY
jgi:hypothetical protein